MDKLMRSMLVIGLATAVAGGSTFALFSDIESSVDNEIGAGTLDLNVDDGDVAVTTFSASNQVPGSSGSGSNTLKNAGSISGDLSISVSSLVNSPGTTTEPEGDVADDHGELGAATNLACFVDANQSGSFDTGDVGLNADGTTYTEGELVYGTVDSYEDASWDAVKVMAAGSSVDFACEWNIPSDVGNEIQDDSVEIEFQFDLDQTVAA